MLTALTIFGAATVMLLLAVVMSSVLGWANRAFHVEVDPRIEKLSLLLPGANCGGCGRVGCGEYAEAIVNEGAAVTECPVGGPTLADAIADIMGVEAGVTIPKKAVVHCRGHAPDRLGRTDYAGEQTCSAAHLVAGQQSCVYGCLGLGECVEACEYDAIHIVDGLAEVDYENCIGCGACSKVCPRDLISMEPFKHDQILVVQCANVDPGAAVRKQCSVGCIGCKACVKIEGDYFCMDGDLAKVNVAVVVGLAPGVEKRQSAPGVETALLRRNAAPKRFLIGK
jgi:electron transport complex protein RnfB